VVLTRKRRGEKLNRTEHVSVRTIHRCRVCIALVGEHLLIDSFFVENGVVLKTPCVNETADRRSDWISAEKHYQGSRCNR
jgi:hypothetical protein